MTKKEVERYILSKVRMAIGTKYDNETIKYYLFEDMNRVNGKLTIPRAIIRTTTSDSVRSYEQQGIESGFIVSKQTNVIKHNVIINFVGICHDFVSIARNIFTHKRGFSWETRKDEVSLVCEDVTAIRDITSHEAKGMLEAYQFELTLKTKEETIVKITRVQKIEDVEIEIKKEA